MNGGMFMAIGQALMAGAGSGEPRPGTGRIVPGSPGTLKLRGDGTTERVVVLRGPGPSGLYPVRLASGRCRGRVIRVAGNRLRGVERRAGR